MGIGGSSWKKRGHSLLCSSGSCCWRVALAVSGGRPGVRSMFLSIGGDVGVLGSSRIGVVLCCWGSFRSTGIAAEKNALMVSCDFHASTYCGAQSALVGAIFFGRMGCCEAVLQDYWKHSGGLRRGVR